MRFGEQLKNDLWDVGRRSSVYKFPISYFFWLAIWRPRATDRLIAACNSPSFSLSHA
jgi:hypothetical protein